MEALSRDHSLATLTGARPTPLRAIKLWSFMAIALLATGLLVIGWRLLRRAYRLGLLG